MRKEIKYKWTEAEEEAFNVLKVHLTTVLILTHPDFDRKFLVFTDTSALGLGAVLAQKDSEDRERVIRYTSRRMSETEREYGAIKLECLGVVWGIQYF